ncbi:TetR/AcrR family transcriptional regulator [Leptospira vanthielii]|uniref:Transcriptional regulator, TetR family n=1 Tax=Leptospira vanthielii serovar Holland str. Waz Holland = ATCC 700522 TaxID=1218591 RepID=N1W9T6_9LEPT|nr:TetR/AcrR family transcriptional regulator [Leptospira vanthielii]EMY70205.1 transcriptional regulator, TetR family [Leptospira vanthielii serovar Holland str. Waz Holland = ATCC 700522]
MKGSPRYRILEIAKKRFYQQGYYHTGINQLIRESGTAKASFYDHFPSKRDLGIRVIQAYGTDVLIWFRQILRESNTPDDFISEMSKAVGIQINEDGSYYQGCPIAIFSCQFPVGEQPFSDEFKSIVFRWESLFAMYIGRWQANGLLEESIGPMELARDLINIYEGALINWRISLNEVYLKRMFAQMSQRLKLGTKK